MRYARAGVLVLGCFLGLAQEAHAAPPTNFATAGSCSPVSGIKPLIRGLVDRNVAPPAANLQASSINVAWSALEPTKTGGILSNNQIDQAIAAAGCTPLRIRVLAGFDATPSWVLSDSGGGITVVNPYSSTQGTAGAFWAPAFQTDYDQFEQLLARQYESVPNVVEFVVSRCALFYPEPFIIGASQSENDTNLLSAGYTEAADQACQQEEIDTAAADWPTTRIGVSFNPYQTLAPASNSNGYTTGTDESYTEQMMAYCRYTLGPRCVLENDSIRDPISAVGGTTPYYTEMYAAMTGASGPIDLTLNGLNVSVPLGAPIAFQTATANNIGDFWGTLEWARQQHAASVELPVDSTYPTSGGAGAPGWQTLAEVSQWFQDVPAFSADQVNATQGTSTSGETVGTLSLSELAAYDTGAGYGDVGSVPFDTVSAVITWPNGAMQAGLVSTGTGTPAPSVTCGDQPICTVSIYSGGYTFPEQPVTGPGSVAIALANSGGAYTPADGTEVVGSFPVTVVPAPLTLKTFTLTPAKTAPTITLGATFDDADPLGVAANYTVGIRWGDGSSTTVPARASGSGFSVSGAHRYKRSGKETVTITISDTGGASVSGSKSITVR